ncbi:TPA: hypothetical protein ACGU88_000898 [Vibrio vulnificus]|uniref:hypothetical protein n=1 Tax=Vibrio vulnificus TaxID=672 RepID=UPI002892FD4A|nr:hypothetical protein [Vibrio vulnificus]WNJ72078.1 hypothetical protein RI132_20300 [Vibrio vulnificus]
MRLTMSTGEVFELSRADRRKVHRMAMQFEIPLMLALDIWVREERIRKQNTVNFEMYRVELRDKFAIINELREEIDTLKNSVNIPKQSESAYKTDIGVIMLGALSESLGVDSNPAIRMMSSVQKEYPMVFDCMFRAGCNFQDLFRYHLQARHEPRLMYKGKVREIDWVHNYNRDSERPCVEPHVFEQGYDYDEFHDQLAEFYNSYWNVIDPDKEVLKDLHYWTKFYGCNYSSPRGFECHIEEDDDGNEYANWVRVDRESLLKLGLLESGENGVCRVDEEHEDLCNENLPAYKVGELLRHYYPEDYKDEDGELFHPIRFFDTDRKDDGVEVPRQKKHKDVIPENLRGTVESLKYFKPWLTEKE